jgi:uncharacterized protein (TIGR00369 family)
MAGNIFDRLEAPPSAALLGWRLVSLDKEAGEIELAFEGKPEFVNPMGVVQGGILSAMLDDTMGPLIVGMTDGRLYGTTIDLHVHFLRPVRAGAIRTTARMVRLGGKIAFIEGQLFDADGKLAATSTCSAFLLEGVIPSAEG